MRELTKKEIKFELESLIELATGRAQLSPATPIKEDINYLRTCILYNAFDLEATRRELEIARELKK